MTARLDLKVHFSCNNRCVFCVQGDKRSWIPPRSGDEIREHLERERARTDAVVFTGGEPTLHPDLLDLVAFAKSLGYQRIQLQTNGRRLAYRDYVESAVRAGVTEVSPALHGSTAAIHDALTRAPGSYRQTLKGIRNCVRAGLLVYTNTVVVRGNLDDLPRTAALLARSGVRHMQFAFVHPEGTALQHFEAVVPRMPDAARWIHKALDVARAAGVSAWAEAMPYCFMHGYEQHVVEAHIPATVVLDCPHTIEDYTAWRWAEGKAKGPPCTQCTWRDVCEGPWREYPDGYGWDEFEPRTDSPPEGLVRVRMRPQPSGGAVDTPGPAGYGKRPVAGGEPGAASSVG